MLSGNNVSYYWPMLHFVVILSLTSCTSVLCLHILVVYNSKIVLIFCMLMNKYQTNNLLYYLFTNGVSYCYVVGIFHLCFIWEQGVLFEHFFIFKCSFVFQCFVTLSIFCHEVNFVCNIWHCFVEIVLELCFRQWYSNRLTHLQLCSM